MSIPPPARRAPGAAFTILLAAALLAALPRAVAAQAGRTGTGWEVEPYGGFLLPVTSGSTDRQLPPPGPSIITSGPTFPSRQVPTWFLGDGAALLNGVNAEFGTGARVDPLDAALGADTIRTRTGATLGVRVRRVLNARWSAEAAFDLFAGSGGLSSDLETAIDTTRASFESAFGALLATGPFTGVAISTTASSSGGAREVAFTGTLQRRFGARGAFTPYVTGGAGVLASAATPSVTVEGHYRFSILGEVPIDETDRLTIRRERPATPVFVFGGGLDRDLGGRWGLRVDGRVYLAKGATLVADAAPVVATGAPADFIESFTNPAVQFSNNPSSGRVSTLGGGLDGFEIVSTGLATRVVLTVGFVARF
ncbi:MAG: hypothetical protein R2752_13000 [Vicinamibacterales bacterium]